MKVKVTIAYASDSENPDETICVEIPYYAYEYLTSTFPDLSRYEQAWDEFKEIVKPLVSDPDTYWYIDTFELEDN